MTFIILLALQRLFRMVFNSATFGVFLLLVFFAYWFLFRKSLRLQNFFLVVVSYIFYGWWDWRFLGLIAISSLFDFFIGIGIENAQTQARKKILLVTTLALNLGLLGFFKYFNFFADSLVSLFSIFNIHLDAPTIDILLPLGVSFYTFQKLAYIIDIYRGKQKACRDTGIFILFTGFFPYVVSGPIERANNMLPQLETLRSFDRDLVVSGLRLMLWGFFKKVVIADNLAQFVDPVYTTPTQYDSASIITATLFFHIQIYADFSGYSDIARGSARLFGFRIMKNFDRPFFSSSLRTYWRRWHISLSSWFSEYLFSPLTVQTRNWGTFGLYFSIMVTFIIIGLWHGPHWSFVTWGCVMGLMISTEQFYAKRKILKGVISVLLVNIAVIYTLIFFRSGTMENIAVIHHKIFSTWGSTAALGNNLLAIYHTPAYFIILLIAVVLFLAGDGYSAKLLPKLNSTSRSLRWLSYYVLLTLILLMGVNNNAPDFVYFKF